jgi:ribosomal protein S27E
VQNSNVTASQGRTSVKWAGCGPRLVSSLGGAVKWLAK